MGSVPPLLFVGTGIIGLGALLNIIGMATTHWVEISLEGNIVGVSFTAEGHQGLFQACVNDCDSISNPDSDLQATQAMVVIGMLLSLVGGAAALLFVVMKLIGKDGAAILSKIPLPACFAAFLFIIIGVIIYGASCYNSDTGDLGYSFALCIVAAILLPIGGVLVFMGGKSVD